MDWPGLIAGEPAPSHAPHAPPEIASLVLRRLRLDGDERLLALAPRDRRLLFDFFIGQALEELDQIEIATAERRAIAALPLLLGERALEDRGRLREAAALYALAHDVERENTGDAARYHALYLRFKLGHALFLLDEEDAANVRRCMELACRTIGLLSDLHPSSVVPACQLRDLGFRLQRWLGWRLRELGEQRPACDAFHAAWRESDDPEEGADCLLAAASILAELGEKQESYRLLLQCPDDLPHGETRRILGMQLSSLQMELGGRLEAVAPLVDPADAELFDVLRRALDDDAMPDAQSLESLIARQETLLVEMADDDDLRHGALLGLASLLLARGDAGRAPALLEEAQALEARLRDGRYGLERTVMLAHWQPQAGLAATATGLFATLLPQIESLDASRRQLAILGFYLEALAKGKRAPAAPELETTEDLVDRLLLLYDSLLATQPGALARRRVRETSQREIESAALALLSAARRVGEASPAGQRMLARAWSVMMRTRNPDLQIAIGTPAAQAVDETLRALEDTFHAALRGSLGSHSQVRDEAWRQALEGLWRHEISVPSPPRVPLAQRLDPSPRALSMAFFQFRALLAHRPLVVLVFWAGRFRVHLVPEADREVVEPLIRWGELLREETRSRQRAPDAGLRDLTRVEAASEDCGEWLEGRALLPGDLPGCGQGEAPVDCHLFPDGLLHAVPIELVPLPRGDGEQPQADGSSFGEALAVRLCLRPSVSSTCEERIDFSRGWLGLGGAPSRAGFRYLRGTRSEILRLSKALRQRGYPARALLGAQAHAGNLRARLASSPPAVLHLAVHGMANPDYPDACALILAPAPGASERELLPFRRVRDLPLAGVRLVVLSACSSLVGPGGKSAGIEGMAWAFLLAGVRQVIASRYSVGDGETCEIMSVLYQQLLAHPVAEALRRTRQECLRRLGMCRREVGAWSLWS
jgi:hypothetical protein